MISQLLSAEYPSFRAVSMVAALCFAATLPPYTVSGDEPVPAGYSQGVPWTGAAGVRERSSDIMARGRVQAALKHPYRIHAMPKNDFTEDSGHETPIHE